MASNLPVTGSVSAARRAVLRRLPGWRRSRAAGCAGRLRRDLLFPVAMRTFYDPEKLRGWMYPLRDRVGASGAGGDERRKVSGVVDSVGGCGKRSAKLLSIGGVGCGTDETVRRRAGAAEARAQRRRRRRHGLADRHAARLARGRPDRHPFAPDPECSE
ncbi:hypothetical protein Asp14428_31730 [Actinoplanes sp. NBRC 14428]|nr:hypothetical protein Asp14428_31730 [Actinoplanes sp. NBRC 14428]